MAASSLQQDDEYFYTNQRDELVMCTENDIDKMVAEDIEMITQYIQSKNREEHSNVPKPEFKTFYVTANRTDGTGIERELSYAILIEPFFRCLHVLLFFRIIFGKFRGTTFYLQLRSDNKEAVMVPNFWIGLSHIQKIVEHYGDMSDATALKLFDERNKDFMSRILITIDPEEAITIITEKIQKSTMDLTSSLQSMLKICPHLKTEAVSVINAAVNDMKRKLEKKESMEGKGKRLRTQ